MNLLYMPAQFTITYYINLISNIDLDSETESTIDLLPAAVSDGEYNHKDYS